MKERIESLFSIEYLRWIVRILLQLKCSSLCGGLAASNNDSWWPPVSMNGGRGGVRVFGRKFYREREKELKT